MKGKSNIIFLGLHTEEHRQSFSEQFRKNRDYVFFGDDNLYPQKLVELADASAKHYSILQAMTDYIAGEGIIFESDRAETMWEEISMDEEESRIRIANSIAYFGGYYLNLVYTVGGQIDKIKPIDFTTVRSGKFVENRVEEYWISRDWRRATKKRHFRKEELIIKPFEIPAFNPDTFRASRKTGQLLQVGMKRPGKWFYPEPHYTGGVNWIEISGKIARFHKSNLDNGMAPSYHVHVFEDLSDEDKQREYEDKINEKFAGEEKAGVIAVTWSTNEELRPVLTPLQINDAHEVYSFLNNAVNEEVASAHRMPLSLAGINVQTGLSGKGQALREELEIFQNTVIRPKKRLIEKTIQRILKINGIDEQPKIKPLTPARFLVSDQVLLEAAERDEIREQLLGLEPKGDNNGSMQDQDN